MSPGGDGPLPGTAAGSCVGRSALVGVAPVSVELMVVPSPAAESTVVPELPDEVVEAVPLVIDASESDGDVSVAEAVLVMSPGNAAVDDVTSVGTTTEETVTSVVVSVDAGGVTAEASTVTSGGAGGGVTSEAVVVVPTGLVVIGAVLAPELTFESDDDEMVLLDKDRVGVVDVLALTVAGAAV